MKPQRRPRWTRLVTTTVLVGVVAAGCGSGEQADSDVPIDSAVDSAPDAAESGAEPEASAPRVVSAEEGAAARARFAPPTASAEVATEAATEAASDLVVADSSTMECGEPYVPTAEEVAEANATVTGLIAAFDRFGVAYTSSTDDHGFIMFDYDYGDVVAQSVADSYWHVTYPVEPIPQEELDAVIAQNDIVAEHLDAAGIAYERNVDASGYESLEYDYDDPTAQAAVEAAWLVISPPQPPTPEQLAQQTDDNAKLMAAFDDAGIPYELVTDELGWAWIEWDYDDPATSERYFEIIDELYPPITIEPIDECVFVDPAIAVDMPTPDAAPLERTDAPVPPTEIAEAPVDAPAPPATDVADVAPVAPADDVVPLPEEIDVAPIDEGPSPEEIARRDAEVDAMVQGFTASGVEHDVVGESPWQSVLFDLDNDASVAVIADVLTARG